MVRVLVAPQEFKGSLSAAEAAAAIAAGIRGARPAWDVDVLPMSDGGPGFIAAMRAALGGETMPAATRDALLRPIEAEVLWVEGQRLAVVESAMANGLVLIAEPERDALAADTFGVGDLIRAALALAPERIVIGVGGSATTDGGHGMARALGARFLDAAGRPLAPGGASLAALERIDWQRPPELARGEVVVATDVTNPLTGPQGAAVVYAPQKGATPGAVAELDAALVRYAHVLRRALGADVAGLAGGGAAGGLAAGLVAFLGASIESGFEIVARLSALEERVARADLVVTGEGSFDSQSLQGKTTGRILERAARAARPAVVLAGRAAPGLAAPGLAARTLAALEPDPSRSMAGAASLLHELAALWASGLDLPD